MKLRLKENPEVECVFAGYNYHGVGEFIAQFPEGDASSEYVKDWEPVEEGADWPEERQ